MLENEELLEKAKEASSTAYCVYSKFAVGACALFESGNYYVGCNVENASYGLCLCAERNAISNAIVAGEKTALVKLAIYSPNATKCFPCGACRQWIKEFDRKKNTLIILEDDNKKVCAYKIDDLLPYSFELNT